MTAPQTVHALLDTHARERGDHPFLLFGGTRTTYREMADRTTRLANALAARGMVLGDRVAIMSANRPEFLEAWFASSRLGAIEVPVNVALRGRFLSYLLADSGARFLVVEAPLLEHVAAVIEAVPGLTTVIVVGAGEGDQDAVLDSAVFDRDVVSFDELRDSGADTPIEIDVDVTDTGVIGYTSGTTGPSKGVMLSHRAAWYAGSDAATERGLTADDVFSTSLPLFHLNAQHLTTIAVLSVGATLALEPRFSASGFWQSLADVRATHVNVIGAMLGILLRLPETPVEWTDYPRMTFAGPLNDELIREARRRWNLGFVTGYGATESGIVTYAGTEGLPDGSCGKPSPHFEVELVDDDGVPVAVGEVGEFVTRPRRAGSMMTAYWGMPEKTVEAFRDLWYHSGDLGRRDENGYLYFVDRKKDAIRRRGENISSFELEQALCDYPGVVEAAALAVPSALSEDDVKACLRVSPDAEFDPAAFLAWAGDHLPRYMIPRYIEVLDEFPRTPTQRVEKYRLRELALSPTTWDAEAGGYLGSDS
jgi:crotonobetaine/carnitine-CoA ligase